MSKSIQDQGAVSGCYGCGPDNVHGLQIKSFWSGDTAIAHFKPKPYHCAGSPDIVYGGLQVSLMDCHSCNFAIARHYHEEGREIGSLPKIFCVTAQLNISLLKPAPITSELTLRASLKSSEGRKTWVNCQLSAGDVICAQGEILVIRLLEKQ
jgi:acyl-coenzyme A thioesterase PaaI-like protein